MIIVLPLSRSVLNYVETESWLVQRLATMDTQKMTLAVFLDVQMDQVTDGNVKTMKAFLPKAAI